MGKNWQQGAARPAENADLFLHHEECSVELLLRGLGISLTGYVHNVRRGVGKRREAAASRGETLPNCWWSCYQVCVATSGKGVVDEIVAGLCGFGPALGAPQRIERK